MSENKIFSFEIISEEGWKNLKERIIEIESSFLKEGYIGNNDAEIRKELSFLSPIFQLYSNFKEKLENLEKIKKEKETVSDSEFYSLLKEEEDEILNSLNSIEKEFEEEIFPPDKDSKRSVFLEIRAGTGGLEASLFASELARMYSMYAAKKNWNFSIVSMAETGVGGCREVILHIIGKNVYEHLKSEAGVHRVQRVPETEGSGRVHTSTVTVAVLPEIEEVEIQIDQKDLRIDTYRASGAGGQHVNKTDSAVRITHIPTNTVVACQDERSQHKNKAKALKILQSRIFAAEKEKQDKKVSEMRKDMVSSAERSDKVRTYNFPQNRVTDHQVNITINRLEFFMQGELNEIIDPLIQKGRINRQVSPLFEIYVKNYGKVQ